MSGSESSSSISMPTANSGSRTGRSSVLEEEIEEDESMFNSESMFKESMRPNPGINPNPVKPNAGDHVPGTGGTGGAPDALEVATEDEFQWPSETTPVSCEIGAFVKTLIGGPFSAESIDASIQHQQLDILTDITSRRKKDINDILASIKGLPTILGKTLTIRVQ